MAAVPSALKSIETIRELISGPSEKKTSRDNRLSLAIHHLS